MEIYLIYADKSDKICTKDKCPKDGKSMKKASPVMRRIIDAAWRLFYENGYDDTTVEQIVRESGTSKGSFYHYFTGKDSLLMSSLSVLFDEKYEELKVTIPESMNAFDKLIYLNKGVFGMIENRIALDLLAKLYSLQLVSAADRYLLDYNRLYYRLIRKIVAEGQEKGELSKEYTVNDIVKLYAMLERALLYDWCICNGEYSLTAYSEKTLNMTLAKIKAE